MIWNSWSDTIFQRQNRPEDTDRIKKNKRKKTNNNLPSNSKFISPKFFMSKRVKYGFDFISPAMFWRTPTWGRSVLKNKEKIPNEKIMSKGVLRVTRIVVEPGWPPQWAIVRKDGLGPKDPSSWTSLHRDNGPRYWTIPESSQCCQGYCIDAVSCLSMPLLGPL